MNNWPQTVLMVSPDHFDIEYSINPHMVDDDGKLNQVDRAEAQKQWQHLKDTFTRLGLDVEVLPGQAGLPDMVFCANQTFPFMKDEKKSVLLSRMFSEQRQSEVAYFKAWAKERNWQVFEWPEAESFEGMGDALWDYDNGQVYGGYGFRTSPKIYSYLEKLLGKKVITFELQDPRFYHLDTCLSLLGQGYAAYVPEAFTPEGLRTLEESFENTLVVPIEEAKKQLAGNMCSVNGKDIILQKGTPKTQKALKEAGFQTHEVETSEFIKSGGSVFCMKQLLFA